MKQVKVMKIVGLLILILISGCSIIEKQEFPRSKSEYINLSFEYPREWKLQQKPYGTMVSDELWILQIPGLESNVSILIQQRADFEEANELFEFIMTNIYSDIDPDLISREFVEVCNQDSELLKYHQPKRLEEDFVVEESDIIDLNFVHENVYYIFEATILSNENKSYDEIQENFLSIIKSIECD